NVTCAHRSFKILIALIEKPALPVSEPQLVPSFWAFPSIESTEPSPETSIPGSGKHRYTTAWRLASGPCPRPQHAPDDPQLPCPLPWQQNPGASQRGFAESASWLGSRAFPAH